MAKYGGSVNALMTVGPAPLKSAILSQTATGGCGAAITVLNDAAMFEAMTERPKSSARSSSITMSEFELLEARNPRISKFPAIIFK